MAHTVTLDNCNDIAQAIADRSEFFVFQQPTPADIEALSKLDAQREYELDNCRFDVLELSEVQ